MTSNTMLLIILINFHILYAYKVAETCLLWSWFVFIRFGFGFGLGLELYGLVNIAGIHVDCESKTSTIFIIRW